MDLTYTFFGLFQGYYHYFPENDFHLHKRKKYDINCVLASIRNNISFKDILRFILNWDKANVRSPPFLSSLQTTKKTMVLSCSFLVFICITL